jgi:hypothetical protein
MRVVVCWLNPREIFCLSSIHFGLVPFLTAPGWWYVQMNQREPHNNKRHQKQKPITNPVLTSAASVKRVEDLIV